MKDLLPYCKTERQKEIINAIAEHGSARAASEALGITLRNVHHAVARIRLNAAQSGYAPEYDMKHPVPPGFMAKGVSTYYDKEGKPAGQWVKSQIVRDGAHEALAAFADELKQDIAPLLPRTPPERTEKELLNLFTLTDCHVGMLSWGQETGADWDIRIAEQVLTDAFSRLMSASPMAGTALVNQLGDFLHTDSMTPVTPTSAHVLDADTRFAKTVRVSVRILRRVVDMALTRHDRVHVIMAEGNHDMAGSVWLREMFAMLYAEEPRVTVDTSPLPYYVHQHGNVMLAFHHGHLRKIQDLPLLFAATFPKVWGASVKRYCHVGHRHHVDEREYAGMLVTQHPTLASRDAYAARGGWFAERQATAITYHSEYGQIARTMVTPEMIA